VVKEKRNGLRKNKNMSKNFHNATQDGPANTITDTWITAPWIIDKIGVSDLDPCGFLPDGTNPIVKTAETYFTEKENGLVQDWSKYKTVFCNLPYSDSYEWLKKCSEEAAKGVEVIVLCFCRTETRGWQQFVKSATGINLINKRIKFLTGEGIEKGNGNAPSCLIAWGEVAYKRIKNVDGILWFGTREYKIVNERCDADADTFGAAFITTAVYAITCSALIGGVIL
jgi:phage N-6-adenine-methyltransferase